MLSYANKAKLNWNQINCGCLWPHNLFTKTLEIQQKHQEKFGVMVFVAKRFCDAGFRGVVIESGVIAVESIGRV